MNDETHEARRQAWRRVPIGLAVAAVSGLVTYAFVVLLVRTGIERQRDRPSDASDRAQTVTPARDAAPRRVPDAWREREIEAVQPSVGRVDRSRFRPPSGGIMAPPEYAPRDPGEWQGMLVNLTLQQVGCEGSSTCGLAMACRDGRCGPCEADTECAAGEQCVLQHCVRAELVSCRAAADCGGESQCMLTGYTAAVRGNEDMRAVCSDPEEPVERAMAAAGRPSSDLHGQANDAQGQAGTPMTTPTRLMDRVLAELAAERE